MIVPAPDKSMWTPCPFGSCQPTPSTIRSPPPHQMTHPIPATLSRNGPIYTQPHCKPVQNPPYPLHGPWSTQAMQIPHGSSCSYPPSTSITAGTVPAPNVNLLSHSFAGPWTSGSNSALSFRGIRLPSTAQSEGTSPQSPSSSSPDLQAYGLATTNGTWSCAYPGCTSRAVFARRCDLRKHHKRHNKNFFCRHSECPQATGGGFSSKKDLARHEAKHNPNVLCEYGGCNRVFSRVENMVRSVILCI